VALAGFLAADQLTHQPNQNPTAKPWVLEPIVAQLGDMHPVPRLGKSRAMAENRALLRIHFKEIPNLENSFLVYRLSLYGNVNLVDRIPITQGFFSLYLKKSNYLRFLAATFTNVVENPFFDLLGVAQVTKPGADFEWLRRQTALPLLTIGQQPVVASSQQMSGRIAQSDYDPRAIVLMPPEFSGKLDAPDGLAARIVSQQIEEHRIVAEVETEGATILRILQSWYPHWRATVDRSPVPVYCADFAFQAIEIPAGRHQVELRFQDSSFLLGQSIAWLTVLGIGFAYPRGNGVRKKKSQEETSRL
jgi:hypothetical protein